MPALEQALFVLIVCALVIIALLVWVAKLLQGILNALKSRGRLFRPEELLHNGDFDTLIERSLAKIEQAPTHANARWYLAKAYYGKQDWAKAKEAFERLAELRPEWRAEHIRPYLDEIEKRL